MSVQSMFPKRKEYRNKKILLACHTMEGGCTVQLPGCPGPHAPTVPAHSNSSDDGKGGAQKSDDCFVAQCCDYCHSILDGRSKPYDVSYFSKQDI